jgi:hypothetical protein
MHAELDNRAVHMKLFLKELVPAQKLGDRLAGYVLRKCFKLLNRLALAVPPILIDLRKVIQIGP